ncbi:MAG: hypothetical protein ACT4P4_22975 [Betaproteobacteria bacterium]
MLRLNARLLPLLAFFLIAGPATAEPRPPLEGVSAVRIANYGAPSVLLEGRDKVGPVVGELNAMRKRAWQRGDTKLPCYSTLIVMKGKKTVALYRIGAEALVEKSEATYSLAVPLAEMPRIARLLTEIPLATRCN